MDRANDTEKRLKQIEARLGELEDIVLNANFAHDERDYYEALEEKHKLMHRKFKVDKYYVECWCGIRHLPPQCTEITESLDEL